MDNQLATTQQRPSALVAMGSRYNVDPAKLLDTLKQTAFKGATDAQMMALVIVSNEMGLNPFLKEIYAFPDKTGGIIPVVGVDGWYRRMNEHPQFNGIEFEMHDSPEGAPVSCTTTIYRKDREKPTRVTEYVAECKRNTDPWNKQPRRMIRHRSAIQCIRVAFGFAGCDPEDAEMINMKVAVGTEVSTMSEPKFLDDAIKKRAKKAEAPKETPPPASPEPEPPAAGADEGEPQPDEAPADPARPQEAEADPHKRLKALLKNAAISDDEFLSYLARNGWGKFSNVFAVPADRAKVCIGDWEAIMEEIMGA